MLVCMIGLNLIRLVTNQTKTVKVALRISHIIGNKSWKYAILYNGIY